MVTFTKSPITEICYDLSWEHYRNRPGISQSWLKLFDRDSGGAPAKAKFYADHPEVRPPPSEAMEDGSCYHAFVLQPDCFDRFYSVCTPSLEAELYGEAQRGKSKAKGFSKSLGTYKAWKDSQEEMGKKVISQERENQLRNMRETLLHNAEIAEYFDGASLEVSAFATSGRSSESYYNQAGEIVGEVHFIDETSRELQLKGRFDLLNKSAGTLLDLKSCRTAHPREFASQAARLGYDLQAAFYFDLARLNGINIKPERVGFVAQDKEPPYLSVIHWLGSDWLRYGRIRYRKILLDVADCIRRDEWPGYENGELMPPAWLLPEVEAMAA